MLSERNDKDNKADLRVEYGHQCRDDRFLFIQCAVAQ